MRRPRPARGGYDRTDGERRLKGVSVDPHTGIGRLPKVGRDYSAPAEEPQQSDDGLLEEQIAKAIAAGHDGARIGRAADLITSGHVFDAGGQGEWIVFSESVKEVKPSDFDWTPGVGKAPPAKRYTAAPQPADGQSLCNCPDNWRRVDSHAGRCKHWLAAVMAANIRRRTGDSTLFAIPDETRPTADDVARRTKARWQSSAGFGYQPGLCAAGAELAKAIAKQMSAEKAVSA